MKKYEEILKTFRNKCFQYILASTLTTYKTGGVIDIVFYPENIKDISSILPILKRNNIDFFILGKGSNILVSDKGFRGVFILTEKLNKIEISENIISADSGVLWDYMIEKSVNLGLAGLEKTSYIPGSVGGAIRMNAGAFGQETFDKLYSFKVIDLNNLDIKDIKKEELDYGYRYVKGIENYFIISGKFSFDYGLKEDLIEIRREIINKRKEKQPLEYPSAGSVFKRPENDYASKLIDICGLKGLKFGGAMVSEKHAGFIVNYDNATSSDIYNLIMKVKEEVFKKTGIELQLEQILVGEF